MHRPTWKAYSPDGVNAMLEDYNAYMDHLEAALARERESVNVSLANQRLEAEVERLKDLIREAAPLEWVMDFEMEEPEEWEEKAKKLLEETDGRP